MAWFFVGLLLGLIVGFLVCVFMIARMLTKNNYIDGEFVKRKEKDENCNSRYS